MPAAACADLGGVRSGRSRSRGNRMCELSQMRHPEQAIWRERKWVTTVERAGVRGPGPCIVKNLSITFDSKNITTNNLLLTRTLPDNSELTHTYYILCSYNELEKRRCHYSAVRVSMENCTGDRGVGRSQEEMIWDMFLKSIVVVFAQPPLNCRV